MHSEHLQNVQFSWVAFGWFVALAVTCAVMLALAASGLLGPGRTGELFALGAAVGIGWLFGGFIIGYKTAAAPILHGAAMGLFTFVAWFLLNLVFGAVTTGASAWEPLTVRGSALALLLQAIAAIAGCWMGYRYAPARVE